MNQKVPNLNLSSRISCPPGVPCTTTVRIGSIDVKALLDSGSSLSVIKQDLLDEIRLSQPNAVQRMGPNTTIAVSASGERLDFNSTATLHLNKVSHLSWDCELSVVTNLPVPLILGYDFFIKSQAILNFQEKQLVFPYGSVPILSLTLRYDELELLYKVGGRLSEVWGCDYQLPFTWEFSTPTLF